MKEQSKTAIKETLKGAGKSALGVGMAMAQSQTGNQDSSGKEEQQKSTYKIELSDHFKEIQRKNKKRRDYAATRYGV